MICHWLLSYNHFLCYYEKGNTMTNNGIIKNIQIKGFKSIKDIDLPLEPLNIIIGSNGVGKTNFISAFKFLNQIANKNLQNYIATSGGADSFLHFGSKNTNELSICLDFDVNAYSVNLINANADTLLIKNEIGYFRADKINFLGGNKKQIITDQISQESNLPKCGTKTIQQHISRFLNSYRVYHFHDTSTTAKVKKTTNSSDNVQLHTDAGNLASMLYFFKSEFPYEYNNIVDTIRLVAPYFKDFVLIPDVNGNILPRWAHKNFEKVFTFDDLSDGTLRFICLATLLLQPSKFLPDTILIDEPELGLHPHAISVLAGLMKSISKKKKQIIASSQSVTLINQFKAQDILIADIKENATNIRRLEEEEVKEWLEDYQLGTIWEKNIIGGTPGDFL